jgi:uncharacterized protein
MLHTSVHLKPIRYIAVPLILAFASGCFAEVAAGSLGQLGSADVPVALPVVFPPVKKTEQKPQPTEQELRTRAETGNVAALLAYGDFLPSPSDFPWYLKAAEAGSPKAMMIVAERAKMGLTPSGKNQALSDEWLNKALQRGKQALSESDTTVLGLLLAGDSYGGSGPDGAALDAATKTQYALTVGRAGGFEIEETGPAVTQAFPQGPEKTRLLQKCSDDGHLWCTSSLAGDYLTGSDGLTVDHAHALELYAKIADSDYGGIPYGYQNLSPAERVQWMKIAIEHGNINSVGDLSRAYCEGNGVPKSERIATALLQAASQRSDYSKGTALAQLAEMHLSGKCLPVNQQLFLKAFNTASSLDDKDRADLAQYAYSWAARTAGFYNDGGPHPDGPAALMIFKTLAQNGPPFNGAVPTWAQYQASLRLADIYFAGKLVKQNYMEDMTWVQQAEAIATGPAKDGFTNDGFAENLIGNFYYNGYGVPKDIKSAISWYQKSVDHKSIWGEFNLAEALMSGTPTKGEIDRAMSLYRASAEAGLGVAQNKLGVLFYDGKYLPQNYKEANDWFEKGIKSNNAWSMRNLAKSYQLGSGVDRDPAKAADLYQKAVDGGDISATIDAAKLLANMYLVGDGIPKDVTKVFALYKKAADAGDAESEVAVGALYQMGQGVNKDLSETFGWFQKAAAQNYAASAAKAELTRLYHDAGGAAEDFNMAASLYEKVSGGQH